MTEEQAIGLALDSVTYSMDRQPTLVIQRYGYSGRTLERYGFTENETIFEVSGNVGQNYEKANGYGRTVAAALEDFLAQALAFRKRRAEDYAAQARTYADSAQQALAKVAEIEAKLAGRT